MGFDALLARMHELKDLSGLIGLATWDEQTYLPPKGEDARSHQLAAIQGLFHERLVDPALGELLERSKLGPLEDDQRAMVRVLSRERDRSVRVPQSLVRALAEAQSRGDSAWRAARRARSFALFAPALKTLLALRRRQADAIGHSGERYDALLDGYEPGMTVARLTPVLARLKARLVPMVRALASARHPEDVLSGRRFEAGAQWRFALRLLEEMGFDFGAGRLDQSIHPFSGGTHPRDVRLTTRIDEGQLSPAVFASIHEGGHGLYEQGFSEAHYRTPLAAAPSAGLHESQSRLWENLIGRSRPFWRRFFPVLQQHFPQSLGDVSAEGFYGAINRVGPSLIRGFADEVTYNLHIVLRYEIELLLIHDQLPLEELPREWNRRMTELLGEPVRCAPARGDRSRRADRARRAEGRHTLATREDPLARFALRRRGTGRARLRPRPARRRLHRICENEIFRAVSHRPLAAPASMSSTNQNRLTRSLSASNSEYDFFTFGPKVSYGATRISVAGSPQI